MKMGTIRTKVSRSHSEIIAFLSLTFCNPNPTYDTNGRFRPYIGIYAQDLRERRENIVSLNARVSKYRIENSISDKPPLYWTYIRKGTVSQYIR